MRAGLWQYDQKLVETRWPFYGWNAMYSMQRAHQMVLLRANRQHG